MAKVRIGHFVEAQIPDAASTTSTSPEVLTLADYAHHIDKWNSRCLSWRPISVRR